MSRISERLSQLKRSGGKGFIPFVTAGDPDLETSKKIVLALAEAGADVIELGVPFSDPMADGPTIQASSQRALKQGATVGRILSLTTEIRALTEVPIVLFSYFNPLFRYGIEKLANDAVEAGIDGVLITDVIDTAAADIGRILRSSGLDMISLIAPTTTDERLLRIAQRSSGFVYAVSRAGITGERAELSASAQTLVARAKLFTDLPIAVGFGISSREQIQDVWHFADAAVVGSAIVGEIERSIGITDEAEAVTNFVARLLPYRKGAVST